MKNKNKTSFLALAGLLLANSLLISQSALAFTLGSGFASTDRGWANHNVTFNVNYTNCTIPQSQLDAAIDDAIALWNGVPTSDLKLSKGVSTDTPAQIAAKTATDTPVIFCDTNFTADTGLDGDAVPGAGIAFPSGGNITYGYFILNAEAGKLANIANIDAHFMSIVIAHEMGHVLGLGHSSDKSSLMYFDGTLKASLALSQDDMDGITFLYPRQEIGGSKILGCSSVQLLDSPKSKKGQGGQGPSGGAAAEVLGLFLCSLLAVSLMKTRAKQH